MVEPEDPDGDIVTFGANGLPPGLAIDASTGVIVGTIADGAADGSPYAADVTATDPQDASTQFQWTVVPGGPGTIPIDVNVIPRRVVNDGRGVIPVVIFGGSQVAVTQIDATTIELEACPLRRSWESPWRCDGTSTATGRKDLVVLIRNVGGALPNGHTTVTVTARTADGTQLAGTDDVVVRR